MIRVFVVLLCTVFFTAVYAANDKVFAWQVVSNEDAEKSNTVYLIGSIHFADESFYPLRKEIMTAFNRSSYLVVELDINKIDYQNYNQIILQQGMYKDGNTIADVLSKQTLIQLQQRLEHLNVDYDAVKNYKPGVLVLTLAAMNVAQLGLDPELGIDAYFLQQAAQQTDMEIIELETLQQQLSLFINIPDSELLLQETLHTLGEADILMDEMIRLWKQGDEVAMNKLLFEDTLNDYPEFAKVYDSLIYRRNNEMVSKIDALLKQSSSNKPIYFVVVGSAHLIGESGIVNQLRAKDYSVTRF